MRETPHVTGFMVYAQVNALFARWDPAEEFMNKPVEKYIVDIYVEKEDNRTRHETTETNILFENLDYNKKYGIRVAAWYNIENIRLRFTRYIVCYPLRTHPPVPTNLRARRHIDRIIITWDEVEKTHEERRFAEYKLTRLRKKDKLATEITTTTTEYIDTDIETDNKYIYSVAAIYMYDRRGAGLNLAISPYSQPVIIHFKNYKLTISLIAE